MMSDPTYLETSELLRHSAWLRGLAHSLVRDEHMAEDAVQETWLRALHRPPRDPRAIGAWLHRSLRNILVNFKRTAERRLRREAGATGPEPAPSPHGVVEHDLVRAAVVQAVLELDEPYRSTVLMRYWSDLEPEQIAQRQGIPSSTVRNRLKRAQDRLRLRLDQDLGHDLRWIRVLLLAGGDPSAVPTLTASSFLAAITGPMAKFAVVVSFLLGPLAWWGLRHGDSSYQPKLPSLAASHPFTPRGTPSTSSLRSRGGGPSDPRHDSETKLPADPVMTQEVMIQKDVGAGARPEATEASPDQGTHATAHAHDLTPSFPCDSFGYSIALGRTWAFVGAPASLDGDGLPASFVFAYRYDGSRYIEQQMLRPEDPLCISFGVSLSSDHHRLLVGAPGARENGAVFVYRLDDVTVEPETVIVPPPELSCHGFGSRVSILDQWAWVVAERSESPNITDAGITDAGVVLAYKCTDDGWLFCEQFEPPHAAMLNFSFGTSVALGNGRGVVGAPHTDSGSQPVGAIVPYYLDGAFWTRSTLLTTADIPDTTPTSRFIELLGGFGTSVALSGDWMAVARATELQDEVVPCRISMFHSEKGRWQWESTLIPPGSHRFLDAIALDEDALLVGGFVGSEAQGVVTIEGVLYRVEGSTWTESLRLSAGECRRPRRCAVALHRQAAMISHEGEEGSSVVVFVLPP